MNSTLTDKQQGELLQQAADAQAPIQPHGVAMGVVGTICTLLVLATIVVGLRLYVRAWVNRSVLRWGWGWDDTFAIAGFIAYLCSSIFTIKAAFYGMGTKDTELTEILKIRAVEYSLYGNIMYGVSMPLIKASVVFTLVRLAPSRMYISILYLMQFLATVMAVTGLLTGSLLHCRPFQANWNPLLGTCASLLVVVKTGYAWTTITIVTDWTCTIIPWFLIRNIPMPKKSKVVVMCILSLAAVASAFSIARLAYLRYYLATEDQLYWAAFISLFGNLESGIALICVCLPSLRQLFRHLDNTVRRPSNEPTNEPHRLSPQRKASNGTGSTARRKPSEGSSETTVVMKKLNTNGKTAANGRKGKGDSLLLEDPELGWYKENDTQCTYFSSSENPLEDCGGLLRN